MSESEVRRIVIACDVQDEIDTAVRKAAELAARWRVPVHGVFLQNENLRRLAELPFGRPVSLTRPGVPQSFDAGDLDRLFSALAAAMRRALAAAAAEAGLDWSFAELRDVPSGAGALLGEGDMLVVEAGVGGLPGAWRPRSFWESVACGFGGMVLLRRGEAAGRRRVVLVIGAASADHDRAFDAARSLALPRDETVMLSVGPAGGEGDAALAAALARRGIRPASTERAGGAAEIRARIAALDPRLVILETEALDAEALQALIGATRCDLLLIG